MPSVVTSDQPITLDYGSDARGVADVVANRGLRVLGGVATGKMLMQDLIEYSITVPRVLALSSVVS
ncbi:hypothetical protein OIE68_01115 [Nocardia vinacea]|uniref:hypothetical protein n=1 Tax=Nocardia vinacea TaxID=96468 RepID=UPI002E11F651|nr:hypothetical protein OIE68_01115 [Nocardia vinacea]